MNMEKAKLTWLSLSLIVIIWCDLESRKSTLSIWMHLVPFKEKIYMINKSITFYVIKTMIYLFRVCVWEREIKSGVPLLIKFLNFSVCLQNQNVDILLSYFKAEHETPCKMQSIIKYARVFKWAEGDKWWKWKAGENQTPDARAAINLSIIEEHCHPCIQPLTLCSFII